MNDAVLFKRAFAPVLLLLLAYEWLVSGMDKVLSGVFVSNLNSQFASSIASMQYGFYARILRNAIMPHATTFAILVEIGELSVGVGFVIVAIALIRDRMNSPIATLGEGLGFLSAFMALNFFFFQGGTIFLNPGDPFDEGITIDFMLVIIGVWIAVFFWLVRRYD